MPSVACAHVVSGCWLWSAAAPPFQASTWGTDQLSRQQCTSTEDQTSMQLANARVLTFCTATGVDRQHNMSCRHASVAHRAHRTATSAHPTLTVQASPSPHLLRAARCPVVTGGKVSLHRAEEWDVVWPLHRILPPTAD